jgi:2-beta-glucuronyltransferase
MIQYTYCRLPILAPQFAKGARAHVCSYDPHDLSDIENAFRMAMVYDRSSIGTSGILSWPQVFDQMVAAADRF